MVEQEYSCQNVDDSSDAVEEEKCHLHFVFSLHVIVGGSISLVKLLVVDGPYILTQDIDEHSRQKNKREKQVCPTYDDRVVIANLLYLFTVDCVLAFQLEPPCNKELKICF